MPTGTAILDFYFAWSLVRDKLCAGGRNYTDGEAAKAISTNFAFYNRGEVYEN